MLFVRIARGVSPRLQAGQMTVHSRGDKDLADKLRDERFGNEHPQTRELPKLIHCQTRRP
jgi:hypothetical protein